jgi:hypothetical protein
MSRKELGGRKMLNKLDRYNGEIDHGYWWMDYDGSLKYSKTLYEKDPEEFFKYAPYVKWWHVQCELDWYRMRRDIRMLEEESIKPIIA